MKTWILILLISLNFSKLANSCGFYPYGDDIRFSLLKPNYVPIYGFSQFHYTSFRYGTFANSFEAFEQAKYDENIISWYNHFQGEFTHQDIYKSLYENKISELSQKNAFSAFEKALLSEKFKEELAYMKFAQSISGLNSWSDDPWERKVNRIIKIRKKQIKNALKFAKSAKNEDLKRRYAYLGVRLSFYNKDYAQLKKIYSSYFEKSEVKDAVYYWSLHFYTYTLDESPAKYVTIAQVFAHSQEKRFASDLQNYGDFSQEEIMKACKTDEEKQAVSFYYLSKKTDNSLSEIKKIGNSLGENSLMYLLLRETNKIEDWILTPYYSEFSPSMSSEGWNDSLYFITRSRISMDRIYAKNVADYLSSINFKNSENELWKKSIQAYLLFLAEDISSSLKFGSHLKMNVEDKKLKRFNEMLLALIELKTQKVANLDSKFIQQTILAEAEKKNYQFLFAIGRELEYAGNTIDAAYLFSHVNVEEENYYYENIDYPQSVFWRTKNLAKSTYNEDFFTDYFYYLDAQYSTKQVAELIQDLQDEDSKNNFSRWKKSKIAKNIHRMNDLLGTKQLRNNELQAALKTFKLVNDSIWKSDAYKTYLNANPFYTDFYTEHSKSFGDTIRFTKVQVVEKLIANLDKIEMSEGKKKAYYCFQVANCYLNMTQYGNSWIMKRYYWSSTAQRHRYADDDEYFQCNLAKKYYLLANESTKDPKISALSLRMAGRCEKYRLTDIGIQNEIYDSEYYDKIFYKNQYYSKLKDQFPDDYEPLISNCYSFEEYNKYLR
jgi:hypothetical protein